MYRRKPIVSLLSLSRLQRIPNPAMVLKRFMASTLHAKNDCGSASLVSNFRTLAERKKILSAGYFEQHLLCYCIFFTGDKGTRQEMHICSCKRTLSTLFSASLCHVPGWYKSSRFHCITR